MRSRSPHQRRRAVEHRSSRSRSRSSAHKKKKQETKDLEKPVRKEKHSHKHAGREKRSDEKQETRSRRHIRRHKDSDPAQRQGRKRKNKSKSRSTSAKREGKTEHGARHGHAHSKSLGDGDKVSLKHSRKRSLSAEGSRSPKSKRKMSEDRSRDATAAKTDVKSDFRELQAKTHSVPKIQQPSKPRHDQTCVSLNERFSQFHSAKEPLVLEKSISIEIERNVDGDEPFVIPNFHPHEVKLPRRSDEGKKPLSNRREFASNREEERTERRVVTVMRSFGRESGPEETRYKSGEVGHGGTATSLPTLFWKSTGRDEVIQVPIVTSQKTKESEMEVSSATDYLGHKSAKARHDDGKKQRETFRARSQERQRFSYSARGDKRSRLPKDDARNQRFVGDAKGRAELPGRRRPIENFRQRIKSSVNLGTKPVAREIQEKPAELPDFSRRPDKYVYDAWKDKPEMIPRGRSYFEHDNRSEDSTWPLNRGRGRRGFMRGSRGRGFVGRGAQNFQNTRMPKRSGSVESLQWKHDKFESLMEDEKPSSTTEK